ncbi:MAG: hypothetical protein CMP39_05160, partial [Rickettsiales bacterium]|nr:hypothetical protein [Rickettsiales bacterium]
MGAVLKKKPEPNYDSILYFFKDDPNCTSLLSKKSKHSVFSEDDLSNDKLINYLRDDEKLILFSMYFRSCNGDEFKHFINIYGEINYQFTLENDFSN